MTSSVRREAASAMVRDPVMARLLVDALKDGSVQAWTLTFRHRYSLIMSQDEEIRTAARSVLESNKEEREQVLKIYERAAEQKGDIARGRGYRHDSDSASRLVPMRGPSPVPLCSSRSG